MDTLMEGKRTGVARSRVRSRSGRPQAAAAQEPASGRSRRDPGPLRRRDRRAACSRRRSSARASPRASRSTRSPAYINETALFRNQWQFRPEKGGDRERRGVQGAHPADAARAARHRAQGRPARARGRVGLLPGELRGRRARRVEGRHAHAGVAAVRVPAPAQGAVPLHLRLLPARRVGRARLRRVPRRDDGPASRASARRSCSPRTSTRTTCCCTACRSR